MLRTLAWIIRRDVLLSVRRMSDVLTSLLFFAIAASLFPLAVGPEPALLRSIAPGVVWVAALLASMLALGRLFALDHADGTLEQMLLASEPLTVIVIGKIVAHWLLTGLPLVLLAPVVAVQFGLPPASVGFLCLGLLPGTLALSFIGAIGAALTLGVRGGGVLVALLVLPLYVPVLIFGVGTVAADPVQAAAPLSLLGAVLAASAALAPGATAAALRIALE